jgi:hypothetical protein
LYRVLSGFAAAQKDQLILDVGAGIWNSICAWFLWRWQHGVLTETRGK